MSIDTNFTFILDRYDDSSVEKLENFLIACQKEISKGKLWIALQANALSDQSNTENGFEDRYKRMMSKLEDIFIVPNLNTNMRNSGKINRACQGVVNQGGNAFKVNNMIERLPSPVTNSPQEEPIFIPVHENDLKPNFQNILTPFLDFKKKILFLHSESFDGKKLKTLLRKNFPRYTPETILQHDNHPNSATKKELQLFLRHSMAKVGIFQAKLVTGMEGSNIIYLFNSKDYINSSVRCTMTRAVSHLCVIYCFRNNSYNPTKFKTIKVRRNYIKCQIKFEYGDYKFKCLTCNTKQICFACSIGCHYDHQAKFEGKGNIENEKCDCRNQCCRNQNCDCRNQIV